MIETILDFFRTTPTDYGARHVWAIGDLQGCHEAFMKLLAMIEFDPTLDRLWLAGDIVNRGEGSLETLEYLYSIKNSVRIVLGNHDISLLAIHHGFKSSNPTLDPIFNSPKVDELLEWLATMPLVHYDKKLKYVMVHAGIPPDFTLTKALHYSTMLKERLHSSKWIERLHKSMVDHYDPYAKRRDRLRYAINAFTRMRFCKENGYLDFSHKTTPPKETKLTPWFKYTHRLPIKPTILFGHWSTLGFTSTNGVICLDTGCVWRGKLSAIRIDDGSNRLVQVECTEGIDIEPESKIMTHFEKITKIPHCSFATTKLRDYLVNFSKNNGYNATLDKAGNILITRGNPTLCLQAHYDMVCMGKAPEVEIYAKNGQLKAKESSLGADNGIAIAMMLALMEKGREVEFLLTNDEEVGLLGAKALSFDICSKHMLNLDFEDEAQLCIGCAGGADIEASLDDQMVESKGEAYEISVKELPGGHSGVDIDKGIPSAIKVLAEVLKQNNITQISYIKAGERINSIPANAKVVIVASSVPLTDERIEIQKLNKKVKVYKNSENIIEILERFKQGVIEYDDTLCMPHSSMNLAIVDGGGEGKIKICTSARSMDKESLDEVINETTAFFQNYGFKCKVDDKYPAWYPETNNFTKLVKSKLAETFGSCKTTAIHAGLECGIIKEKYPHIEFASIGPTIKYPHSTRETLCIDSAERTFETLEKIIDETSI